jgi:transposase-like protein
MPSHLSASHFHNEEAAYAFVEARIWPNGATCPKCGERDRVSKMGGKSTRIGVHKCYVCRKPFTVKVGTIFEASHVPMHIWLQAIYLMVGSKKGISSQQLHRTLGVTLKTAWFMSHRIREAMRSGELAPMGGDGGMVEIDETFIGNDPELPKAPKARGYQHKMKVLSLVDRATGRAKSMVVDDLNAKAILPILQANIAKEAVVLTDEAGYHQKLAADFSGHYFVSHRAGEYVRAAMRKSIPTPSKGSSPSSSVGCAASISIAASGTCTATWPSLISATATVSRLASTTPPAPTLRCWASSASV